MSRPCGQPRFTRALVGSSDMRRPHVENARTYSEHTHRKSPPNLSVCDRLHAPAPRTAHPQVAVTHIGHLGNPPPPPLCVFQHQWAKNTGGLWLSRSVSPSYTPSCSGCRSAGRRFNPTKSVHCLHTGALTHLVLL